MTSATKTCVKFDATITDPVLANDIDERCERCGDEPGSIVTRTMTITIAAAFDEIEAVLADIRGLVNEGTEHAPYVADINIGTAPSFWWGEGYSAAVYRTDSPIPAPADDVTDSEWSAQVFADRNEWRRGARAGFLCYFGGKTNPARSAR